MAVKEVRVQMKQLLYSTVSHRQDAVAIDYELRKALTARKPPR